MKKSNLILVVGETATGKTTLANEIASSLNLPVFSKDSLKVILFDNLGWKDRQWSREIGRASVEVLDYIIEENLKAGNSLVIENVFHLEFANPKFQTWHERYGFNAIQVICHADEEIIIERFKERARSDNRHVSHTEGDEGLKDLQKRLKNKTENVIDIKSEIIKVDTSDFSKVDDTKIIEQVRSALL